MTYTTQPQVQSVLRNGGFQPAAVDAFSAQSASLENVSLRGARMGTAAGSFSGQLQQALVVELQQADLYDPAADTRIGGTLLVNTVRSAGISTGSAEIEAEFVVTRNGSVVYTGTKVSAGQWESSFAGARAVPLAVQGYAGVFRELVVELFNDPQFQEAIR